MEIDGIELIGGHPALDFVNTVEARGADTELNYLSDFERLARWSERAGLISSATLLRALREAKQDPDRAGQAWREAMKLRDSLNRIFRALSCAGPLSKQAIAPVNAMLQAAFDFRQLAPTGSGRLDLSWREDTHAVDIPVFEIALAATALLTNERAHGRIKTCANNPCDWVFLDTSRNSRRRWCRMAVCGNLSKVRRFRQRQRDLR